MSKKVTSNEHHSTTRERVMAPSGKPSSRAKRRAEQRKLAKALKKQRIAAKIAANPRLVRA